MKNKLLPFFSVVIPTYNRPAKLAACLLSLSGLDYPRERFEVVVVDDGSPLSLEEVVQPFRAKCDITLLRQENAGPGHARNAGVEHARGEYIAFTDDDCTLPPDWLTKLAKRVEAHPDHMIGGRTVNKLRRNIYSSASQMLLDYIYGYFNGEEVGSARFFAGDNFCMPRAALLEIGGFHSEYRYAAAEDRELCDHWFRRGRPLTFAPEIIIFHAHDLSLRTFWKQHFRYGRGAWDFHVIRARRAESSGQYQHRIEPLSFYWKLLLYPTTCTGGARAWYLCFLMGLSQVAHTAGFFVEKRHWTVEGIASRDAA